MKLILVNLLFGLSLSISKENYGYSTYCQPCISPCKIEPTKGYYWCKTYDWTWENKVYTWDYCSISDDVEYMGKTCSSICAYHGEAYQWCTSGESWGYCSGKFCTSDEPELPDYGYSTYCQRCITPCEQVGSSKNYWCGTQKWNFGNKTWTWDYCSPNSGVDFQGNRCLDMCSFKAKDYQWCKTEVADAKGYCTGKGNVLCDFKPLFE